MVELADVVDVIQRSYFGENVNSMVEFADVADIIQRSYFFGENATSIVKFADGQIYQYNPKVHLFLVNNVFFSC